MAQTRIIDLTEATQTASDDYIVIDGATNGTRKVSASEVGGESMFDFETTLTPAINSNGTASHLYIIVPKDLTTITLKDALKISAYLYRTGTDYEEAIPLIVTVCRSNTGVSYLLAVKCIESSPQGTGNTISGKLHIVAPFEIDSVTATM